jgi:U3 small nucleolar RNA-associated protein 6
MKKRTAFETALVRRVAKKNDYLRYVTYEMGLEALRKKRVERLSECLATQDSKTILS